MSNLILPSGLTQCARCGATAVKVNQDGVCFFCEHKPEEEIMPIMVPRSQDLTEERYNTSKAILAMYERLKEMGKEMSHQGIYLDEIQGQIAVRVIEICEPSDYWKWARSVVER